MILNNIILTSATCLVFCCILIWATVDTIGWDGSSFKKGSFLIYIVIISFFTFFISIIVKIWI